MNLLEQIDHWGQVCPDRIAHHSGNQKITYAELSQKSARLAQFILEKAPEPGAPVAVIGHKEPEMLVGFLAAIKAGHPYIPIDTSIPQQRISAILEISKAALVFTPQEISTLLSSNGLAVQKTAFQALKPEDPWYIIFTSGSTGEPKGVVITRECLENFVGWMLAEQTLAEHPLRPQAEVFLNQAPFSFDLSVMDLYLSLVTGGTLFSIQQEMISNPRSLFSILPHSGLSVWVSTPSFAEMCLVEPTFQQDMLPELRRFLFCGETLTPKVAAQLLERFPQAEVWNTYGPTETTVATTSIRITPEVLARFSPLPIGYPKPDSEIVILKPDGTPAPDEVRGEILIAGPNVSPGYLGRADLTARSFLKRDGKQAYRTGDWGHCQAGLLFFDGRIDQQIKLHGYRIELGDVEANLCALPEISDAVVLPSLRNGSVHSLVAFVILKADLPGSEFEITRSLRQQLSDLVPAYMVPRKFYYKDVFPMTLNGKADRKKLSAEIT